MRDIKHNIYDKIVWILTVIMIASLVIFELKTWEKYLFFGAAIIIYFLYYMKNKSLRFPFDSFQKYILPFIFYTFLSVFWALDVSDSIEKGLTLFQIFFVFSLLYMYYRKADDIENLLKAIKWGGYLVSIYTVYYFGLSTLLGAAETNRLANEFANVNVIGLLCALACYIQIFEILYNKMTLQSIMLIPCSIVILATQSRKAFLFVIVGWLSLYLWKNIRRGNVIKVLVSVIFMIAIVIICYKLIESSSLFSGISKRMDLLFSADGSSGQIDYSTKNRNEFIDFTIKKWLESPVYGHGIGSTHILIKRFFGMDTYSHNNLVELLSGGGIVGFCLYYAGYIYLFFAMIKYRKNDYKMFSFGIIWLLLMLFMDYGMVTYFSKSHWFYMMVLFLNVYFLKKKEGISSLESII